MTNPEKEAKARKLLAEAQRKIIEADRLLDGHAASVHAKKSIRSLDESLEWLQESPGKEVAS